MNDRSVTGTITAVDGAVTLPLSGRKGAGFILTGTWTATVACQVSVDGGTTWVTVDHYRFSDETRAATTATNGSFAISDLRGASHVRVTATAYTTGTINVTLNTSAADAVGVGATITVDTEIGAAAALADATANPTTGSLGALGLLFNGTTWDRMRGDITNGLDVDVTRMSALVAGSAVIGEVGVTELPAAAALADAAANPTTTTTGAASLLFNGTTWDRMRGDTTNGLDVDVTRMSALVAGSAVIGEVGVTELPAAGALADTAANPTTTSVGALALLFNGTTWDRMRGDTTNGLDVDVTRMSALVAGSAIIGEVGVTELPAAAALADDAANPTTTTVGAMLSGFDGTTWDRLRTGTPASLVTAASTGRLQVQGFLYEDSGGGSFSSPMASAGAVGDAAAGRNHLIVAPWVFNGTTYDRVRGDATGGLFSQGAIAHDAADTGNPIKIGGKGTADEPTAVTEGDRVNAWFDLFGRQVTIDGHPNTELPVTVNGSAAGTSIIAAPGAGISIYVKKVSIYNRAATATVISLRDGAAGTIRFTANITKGDEAKADFGSRGWKLTANTALVADISQASADVNITEYYLAA